MDLEFVKKALTANSISHDLSQPLIVVIRETDSNLQLRKDDGTNVCDTILLVKDVVRAVLNGRSIPHANYQAKQVAGTGAANKLASQYRFAAEKPGLHTPTGLPGFLGLIMNAPMLVWRSSNMIWGDDDDTVQYLAANQLWDNVHGYAPYSAGCITIVGSMLLGDGTGQLSGDWATAHNWIYKENNGRVHGNDQPALDASQQYSVLILEHDDVTFPKRLRAGSTGVPVMQLQTALGLGANCDGVFGPGTFAAVQAEQRKRGLHDNGIWDL